MAKTSAKFRSKLAAMLCVAVVAMQCVAAVPTRLSCEYCENPVGVEASKPRLSWWLPEGAKEQTAYRVVVGGALGFGLGRKQPVGERPVRRQGTR